MQVLYGLEYAHAVESLRTESSTFDRVHFADVTGSVINPLENKETPILELESSNSYVANGSHNDTKQMGSILDGTRFSIGGLTWNLPHGHKMEEYTLFWIGSDNPAFANVVLTFNTSEIGKTFFCFL